MRRASSPAAMEASTNRSFLAFRMGTSPESICSIIWGFTPRKIRLHSRATVSLSAVCAPSSRATASALDRVRLARRTGAPWAPLTAARATAAPMVPVPIKPMDENILLVLLQVLTWEYLFTLIIHIPSLFCNLYFFQKTFGDRNGSLLQLRRPPHPKKILNSS